MHGLGVLVLLSIIGFSTEAIARGSVAEEIIAARNPCQGLTTRQFGMTIGVERLKDVRLDRATVELEGDRASIDLDGRLACETSPGATISGDASARVRTTARVRIDACVVEALDVWLSDFGGTFGPILAAFASTLETELVKGLEPRLRETCEEFRGQRY